MKEGRLQLWLYMFGVQNIGTAGILIDIVKESKQMRLPHEAVSFVLSPPRLQSQIQLPNILI